MFDEVFIKKAKGFLLFIVVYTLLFALFFSTLSYTGPFVFALLIALITRPFTNLLIRRLKFPRGVAALVSTILVFILLLLIISAIFFKITIEAKQLYASLPGIDLDSIVKFFAGYISRLKLYSDQVDPTIVQKVTEQINLLTKSTLNIVMNITMNITNWLISFAIGLPVIVMVVFVALLATYFFSKDIAGMEHGFTSMFSPKGKEDVKAIWKEAVRMLTGYAKAYSAVVSLRFWNHI
jgi:predicted PurR-regulated permease PerM